MGKKSWYRQSAVMKSIAVASLVFCLAACEEDKENSDGPRLLPPPEESSSSEAVESEVDSLIDARDGQVYKTVVIGSQVWMAQNLNYKSTSSYCYNNDTTFCKWFGRLYKWPIAVGKSKEECGSDKSCEFSESVQGVCPTGWHLPSEAEWKRLFKTVGGYFLAGSMLKATKVWDDGRGSDDFGFAVLPAGYKAYEYQGKVSDDYFHDEGRGSIFWTSTESARNVFFSYNYDYAYWGSYDKNYGFSIRCLRDNGPKVAKKQTAGSSSSAGEVNDASLVDTRDGQVYKTVVIGKQTWMARNLNFAMNDSYCYDEKKANCKKYGRLYTWNAAVRACPAGWHLPDDAEWKALLELVGDDKKLKSTVGWYYEDRDGKRHGKGNGSDSVGFSAMPAGYGYSYFNERGKKRPFWSYGMGEDTYFWSSSVSYFLGNTNGYVGFHFDEVARDPKLANAFSVRCLKN